VFVFLRAFLVDGKTDPGMKLMEETRIYPLAQKDNPPAMKFPNASATPADYDFKRDLRSARADAVTWRGPALC
jgi:hypothetical protein